MGFTAALCPRASPSVSNLWISGLPDASLGAAWLYAPGIHFWMIGGAPYVVSELLEGETLRDCLKRGPLSLRKALDYAFQVARSAFHGAL